jgi:predicted O-methyltransferase YrrM
MQNISKNPFLFLGQENAYEGLAIEDHEIDLQGWVHPDFDNIIKPWIMNLPENSFIIEVGSWKGLSTNKIADCIKSNGKKGYVIAIDTWLGAPEFWMASGDDTGHDLKKVHGHPSIYFTFVRNVKKLGNEKIIVPFPISSMQGYDVLSRNQVAADLIYIDASHEEEAAFQDISKYFSLLKPGAIIFGDDYSPQYWPGVLAAVNKFAQQNNLEIKVIEAPFNSNHIWYIQKPMVNDSV